MLKGWLIPARSEKLIIMTHPFTFNRHGFLVKNQGLMTRLRPDVDLLKTAQALNHQGYSVLMFDFRNHGESATGVTGIGLSEYQDIAGALDYIRSQDGLRSKAVGLVSFCMGANASIIGISKCRENFSGVKCLVAIQPVSIGIFMDHYARKTYTPLGLVLLPLIDRICRWRGGFAFKQMSPLAFCKDLNIPTFYIQAKTDPWTDLTDVKGFYESTPASKELWIIEDKMGRFDAYNYVGEHPEKIISFLNKYL